ncbi:MAG: GNAT family N-acetyltransferase [Clostridia bacterium]|nr:GNAT family N-acetyltransferase [Clostridia bacterium]
MQTERLMIDPVTESDRQDYFINISHDRKVLETFVCRYAETPEEVDLTKIIGNPDVFAIRLKQTGRLIGLILFFGAEGGSCEIGYGIGSSYWGQGYTTEAVRRFLEYLFEERGFTAVRASFFTGNTASKRVMEKNGMRYSHFAEKELVYLDIPRDLTYYSVTKEEWETKL